MVDCASATLEMADEKVRIPTEPWEGRVARQSVPDYQGQKRRTLGMKEAVQMLGEVHQNVPSPPVSCLVDGKLLLLLSAPI